MQIYRVLLALLLISGFVPAKSFAQQSSGYYLSGFIGLGGDFGSNTFEIPGLGLSGDFEADAGLGLSLAFGHAFSSGWRVEGALSYFKSESATVITSNNVAGDVGDGNTRSFMLNGYYDFRKNERLQPYVGLGVGMVDSDYNSTSVSLTGGLADLNNSNRKAAGQAILGLGYWTGENVLLSAEYRFLSTFGEADFGLSDGSTYRAKIDFHNLIFGLRYTF